MKDFSLKSHQKFYKELLQIDRENPIEKSGGKLNSIFTKKEIRMAMTGDHPITDGLI